MPKASDNDFPSILVTEQASKPTAPAAGKQRLYMKTDHKLYHEDSGATETVIGGTGDVVGPGSATDGHLAVFDGTTGKLIKDGGAVGSGGNTISTGTLSGIPAAGTAGNVYLPSDAPYVFRDTGAAWAPWGPIFKLTQPPAVNTWAWINQGGATAVDTNGGIFLYAPAASGDNARVLKRAAPATPYTITALIAPQLYNYNYANCGIGFRNSSSGKLAVINTGSGSNLPNLQSAKFSAATSGDGQYVSVYVVPSSLLWFRISDDGSSNRVVSWSTNGYGFTQLHSVGRTDYLTADEVLIYVNAVNATYPAAMYLYSWAVT